MITSKEIHKEFSRSNKNKRMSQTMLTKELKIRQPAISKYIHGKSLPSLETFANLCKILDVDSNEILCIDKK